MSSSLPVLCSFHTPVEPGLVSLHISRTVLRACRVLDGKTLTQDRVVNFLRKACGGVGEVKVEEGYIIWEIRYSSLEIADATERALNLAKRTSGSPNRVRLIPMTDVEARRLIRALRESNEVSVDYAVLIRFRKVGKLKAN